MASYKRKFDHLDDVDEDEPSYGKQILPVAPLPDDFDEPPMDGMQYLFTVRRDARALPHITRADNPYEQPETLPIPPQDIASHPAMPTAEWLNVFEKGFRRFRGNLNQPTIHVQVPSSVSNSRLMPDKQDRDSWWNFLAGKPRVDWDPPKSKQKQSNGKQRGFGRGMRAFDDDSKEFDVLDYQTNDTDSPNVSHIHLSTKSSSPLVIASSLTMQGGSGEHIGNPPPLKPREPNMGFLSHINERTALHLLMYFAHWINLHIQETDSSPSYHITESHARWIFVLLSRVDDYISADDMSLLRNLVRACFGLLRKRMQERLINGPDEAGTPSARDSMAESSCWLIISIVVGIWAQRDLWIDAKDIVASLTPPGSG